MNPLTSKTIRGNWATVLLPIGSDDRIDLPRLQAAVERIADFGVDGLYTNGTAGEFHTQSEAEFDAVNALVAEVCARRSLPFQIGVSHMSAQISLGRLRRSKALAPSAVQVILPDWVVLTETERIDFLNRMAEEADPIGLVLYNPPHAKLRLNPAEFGRLRAAVPSLLGVKVAGGDSAWYREMRAHMEGLSVFVPGHHLATGMREGAHGAYSNVACIHPGAAQRWYDLMASDLAAALVIEAQIQAFFAKHIVPLSQSGYSNPALDKFLAAMGGWADLGTRLRWPYRFLPEQDAVALRDAFKQSVPRFAAWMD